MKSTINERIVILKNHNNMNDVEFCRLIEISNGTFQRIKKNEKISRTTINSIIKNTGVNREWLVDGIGEMEITPPEAQNSVNRESISAMKNHINHLTDEIKFYREVIQNLTIKIANANFKSPTAPTGVLPQNFGSSVRVSA